MVLLIPLAETVLIPLGLTTEASTTDSAIHIKKFGLGVTPLTISKEEINGITKIIKYLEEHGLLIKGVSKAIKMKQKNKKEDFSECY